MKKRTRRMVAILMVSFLFTFAGCSGNGKKESSQPSHSFSSSQTADDRSNETSTDLASSKMASNNEVNTKSTGANEVSGKESSGKKILSSSRQDISHTSSAASDEVNWTPPATTEIGIWYSTWYAKTQERSDKNTENTWTAWNINIEPLMPDKTFRTYDSLEEDVLLFHLQQMASIKIDFIIMDQTNHIDIDGGYINERSLKMADMVKKFNDNTVNKQKVKYCSAVGAIQWSNNLATIEEEARMLYLRYVFNNELGSPKYHYYVDGKPLMIVYGNINEEDWRNYNGDKTFADMFTLGFANNASTPGYYGWAFDKGTQWHDETVVVMPGWDNRKGAKPVPRERGDWYERSWNVLFQAPKKPRRIIINSFNEYAECTAIFPAKTEKYPNMQFINKKGEFDPYMYWDLTRDYIIKFKAINKPLAKQY